MRKADRQVWKEETKGLFRPAGEEKREESLAELRPATDPEDVSLEQDPPRYEHLQTLLLPSSLHDPEPA
jgi:hypothetical protein